MKHVVILWKTDNDIDIHNLVIPFAYNALVQEWFDHVTLLIWGASQKRVLEDKMIGERVKNLREQGIRTVACKMCAENIHTAEYLEGLNIEVIYAGKLLSDSLKDPDTEVVTF
jgi:hypothetical protein